MGGTAYRVSLEENLLRPEQIDCSGLQWFSMNTIHITEKSFVETPCNMTKNIKTTTDQSLKNSFPWAFSRAETKYRPWILLNCVKMTDPKGVFWFKKKNTKDFVENRVHWKYFFRFGQHVHCSSLSDHHDPVEGAVFVLTINATVWLLRGRISADLRTARSNSSSNSQLFFTCSTRKKQTRPI